MKKATVFNIQKFSIHDGHGIRTVVFLKGCPLRCLWCANPESQAVEPEITVLRANCIGCGACAAVCPTGAIHFDEGGVGIARSLCICCGACTEECYSRTLKMTGQEMTVDEVFEKIADDAAFYKNSGGGYTLSGGEPLMQAEFCLELVKKCSDAGFCGAMETCGCGSADDLLQLSRQLELIFFDIKHIDPERHKALTGISNERILENFRAIQDTANEIVIRTPVIPGINDSLECIEAIAQLGAAARQVSAMELLPYHQLGVHKYDLLDRTYALRDLSRPEHKSMEILADAANVIMQRAGKRCILNTSSGI